MMANVMSHVKVTRMRCVEEIGGILSTVLEQWVSHIVIHGNKINIRNLSNMGFHRMYKEPPLQHYALSAAHFIPLPNWILFKL